MVKLSDLKAKFEKTTKLELSDGIVVEVYETATVDLQIEASKFITVAPDGSVGTSEDGGGFAHLLSILPRFVCSRNVEGDDGKIAEINETNLKILGAENISIIVEQMNEKFSDNDSEKKKNISKSLPNEKKLVENTNELKNIKT